MFKNDRFIVYFTVTATDISPPFPPEDALPSSHFSRHYAPSLRKINDIFYQIILFLQLGSILFLAGKSSLLNRTFQRSWTFLILVGLYFPLFSAIFISSPRFRWPTSVILLPFAAYGLIEIIPRIQNRHAQPSEGKG